MVSELAYNDDFLLTTKASLYEYPMSKYHTRNTKGSTDSIFIPNIVKHAPLILHVCNKLCLPRTGMSSPQHPPMLSPAKERMGGYRMGPVDGHCPGTQLYYDDWLVSGPAEVRPATDGGSSGRVATYLLSLVLCHSQCSDTEQPMVTWIVKNLKLGELFNRILMFE